MDIYVSAKRGKRLEIYPDPATIAVGENVAWQLYYDGRDEPSADSLVWSIYLSSGSPFETQEDHAVQTDPKYGPEQKGKVEAGPARSPGDYKYGVRVSNARTKEVVCDDDPRLIVRSTSR